MTPFPIEGSPLFQAIPSHVVDEIEIFEDRE